MNPFEHLPRVEISLDNLVHNLGVIRSRLGAGQSVMAVVKDCAYGCGARVVARTLEEEGVDFFAVARADEAKDLRAGAIRSPILVLGECSADEALWAAANDVRLSVNDAADVDALGALGAHVRVHVNIDTGMRRMGILAAEARAVAAQLLSYPGIEVEALYSHFASADVPKTRTVQAQYRRFVRAQEAFGKAGIKPRLIHVANTAAIARFPLTAAHYVRPGIALYGCSPNPSQDFGLPLRPIASLKAHVIKLKKVPKGSPVSYGGRYVARCTTYIATIPLGYAHGVPRLLTNKGHVLIGGKRYRIAGTVTMDYIMVDAGPKPHMAVGDEAVVMGLQGDDCIHPDEVARQCKTIAYEILCCLSKRIDRYYLRGGKVVVHESGANY